MKELFIDSHHGIYSGKIAYEVLKNKYKEQIGFTEEEEQDILNIESEFHWEAVEKLLNTEFTTEEGIKFYLHQDEDIWVIDEVELENMKRKDEFICHGIYAISNSMGYEIQISNCGDAARINDGETVSDWLEIVFIGTEKSEDDLQPVIDPGGYNIPLNLVMKTI